MSLRNLHLLQNHENIILKSFLTLKKYLIYLLLGGGEERETKRARNTHGLPLAAHNPGTGCPDWELTQPFWFTGRHSVPWATPARAKLSYFWLSCTKCLAMTFEHGVCTVQVKIYFVLNEYPSGPQLLKKSDSSSPCSGGPPSWWIQKNESISLGIPIIYVDYTPYVSYGLFCIFYQAVFGLFSL